MAGSLTRAICYTIGFCITRLWIKLVLFWCLSSRIKTKFIQEPELYATWFKYNLVFLWLVLLPTDIFSVWYTPGCHSKEEGCLNAQVSCINRGLLDVALLLNVIIGLICTKFLLSALGTLRDGGTAALFKGSWKYVSSDGPVSAPDLRVSALLPELCFSDISSSHPLDPDVESIFQYEAQTPVIRLRTQSYPPASRDTPSVAATSTGTASATTIASRRQWLESAPEKCEEPKGRASESTNDSQYRKSDIELTKSLLMSQVILPDEQSQPSRQESTESDMGTADDIMRRQTKRIIIYVSTLLVLSCGTMLYDATFCSLKGDDEIVYSSPPCDNRDVLLASSNLFYTGEVRDV